MAPRVLFSISACIVHVVSGSSCGDAPKALETDKPNVLIIGDSVSMPAPYEGSCSGYGLPIRTLLTDAGVNVQHNGGWIWDVKANALNSEHGIQCASQWLDVSGTWDVIQFNFGLHDIAANEEGGPMEHVDLEPYGQNLVAIYWQLAAKARHVIWASTTPCPDSSELNHGRNDSLVRMYNAKAKEVLEAEGLAQTTDLYQAVTGHCGVGFATCNLQCANNVHFTASGREFLGQHVAQGILSALGRQTSAQHGNANLVV